MKWLCRWMINLTSWGFTNRWTATTVLDRMNLSKTQTLTRVEATEYKEFRSWEIPPGRTPNGLNSIHGPKTEKGWCNTETDSGCHLISTIPSTPDEFEPETSAIGSVLKLSFQPYQVRPNPTLYETWASVLVRAVPVVWNWNEVESDWASNLGWTPSLAS